MIDLYEIKITLISILSIGSFWTIGSLEKVDIGSKILFTVLIGCISVYKLTKKKEK
jgi:hypothetical protein